MRARTIIIIFTICCSSCCSDQSLVSAARLRRQVVQPVWLMRPDLLPSAQAAKVNVTPQKIEEVAALRATIQKAINDGTYVVDASPQQFISSLGQATNPLAAGGQLPMPVLPAWLRPG
ncbi:hypothetical protein AWZ03_010255 [Drosophila navojoa]|uniref:Anti-sigma-28 factor FlgM C-terminal domain-containing protein n=1 Tax=Drosophila navojoa TaxID=7232 RepID=A0A484B5H2_DRONA|nr:uncharacterized protein LOC108657151 [Drosophila navojoa]TDG43320.1 hypothetical protein AWZ03_010255 [Drosophila navojoa]